ncbi:MAG: 3'-5' exonuclease [Firmicutes bacterium]|nr:3'-5' exonuclease [Bacillota bacterium]
MRLITSIESLVFVDVETTGLNPIADRVIEIFMLKLWSSGEVEEYGTLINPGRPLPEIITEITGLTDEDLADSPSEADVAQNIRDFIGNGTLVAHNLQFDRRFLNAMFQRTKQPPLSDSGIDTLALARNLFPKLCIYPGGGGSHKLSNLMYHFGLDGLYSNSHRARDDVMLLVEVYRHLQDHALGRSGVTYPAAVTHGCPVCGSAMRMEVGSNQYTLICTKEPACAGKLVV